MTPDQVIDGLNLLGISMSRRTLLRYEIMGLIDKAKRGGMGRGKGRVTEYPECTPFDAYTAHVLIGQGNTREKIAEARKEALNLINCFFTDRIHSFLEIMTHEQIVDAFIVYNLIDDLVYEWIMTRIKIEYNIPQEERIHICFEGYCDSSDSSRQIFRFEDAKEAIYYIGETSGVIDFEDNSTMITFRYTRAKDRGIQIKTRDEFSPA